MTRAKVDELARHFHQPRAAVMCHITLWGLQRGHQEKIDQGHAQGAVCHLNLYVAADLHHRVQGAATAAGADLAPWLRHMVRRISIADFPASWQEARCEARSHDSRTYGKRFMMRLDEPTQQKPEDLSTHFETSIADVIRELAAQATPDDFPTSWHMRAAERRTPQTRQRGLVQAREPRPRDQGTGGP